MFGIKKWLKKLVGGSIAIKKVRPATLFFTNTLSGKKELFIPIKPGFVFMYSCGPTVYGPAQIGNLRSLVFSDILARTLMAAGYRVMRVINITDVGHLVTDGDDGEDKMTKGLRREGLEISLSNMRMMGEKYTQSFLDDLAQLNIDTDTIKFPRASDYISEQIALITTLEQKGYCYRTKNGIYFDTARFHNYGALGGVCLKNTGKTRLQNIDKHSDADFVLWKSDPNLGWESPWGRGFPGWHIECSAMSRALLGQEIDIHTGGEDLTHIHHNNEIAQSEAASGRAFVRYWMHNAFLTVGGEKASKSLGNAVYLSDCIARGIEPIALRYFFLQAHYRTPLSFSWDALEGAASALSRLRALAEHISNESNRKSEDSFVREQFLTYMRDDLSTPQALGLLWESLKNDEYSAEEKWGLLEDAEAHLGLSLLDFKNVKIGHSSDDVASAPKAVQNLLQRREKARDAKNYAEADRIRDELQARGYRVDDGPDGPMLTRIEV